MFFDEVKVIDYSANLKFARRHCILLYSGSPNIELFEIFAGRASSWKGGLWDCVCGDPVEGRAEGRHQARRQGQDQGVGQGKSPGEGGEEGDEGGKVVYNVDVRGC